MLSTEEFEALFTRIDTDEDGLLTAWELKELLGTLGQPVSDDAAGTMLGFIDTDGDGRVTREELRAYLDAPTDESLPAAASEVSAATEPGDTIED